MKDSPQQKTKYVALQAVSCSSIQSNMLIQRRALRVRFSLLFSELLFSFKSKTFRKNSQNYQFRPYINYGSFYAYKKSILVLLSLEGFHFATFFERYSERKA